MTANPPQRDIEALLSAPDIEQPLAWRDRALLELGYGAGLRVSELCGMTLTDLLPADPDADALFAVTAWDSGADHLVTVDAPLLALGDPRIIPPSALNLN